MRNQERLKGQRGQPRTCALVPVMHSPVPSHRTLLCAPLNWRNWLSSVAAGARSPFVQGGRDRIRRTQAAKVSNRDAVCKYAVVFIVFNTQETYVAVSGVDGWDCRKWSSFSV
ncbi:hypothetical protein MRX96_058547 [Rhipicephalus microplus]